MFFGDDFAGMATATGSVANECSSVRIIIQQCLSARLQVQPPTENEDAKWVEVSMTACKQVLMAWRSTCHVANPLTCKI